jgi:membrane associated rhomboid family serine protease
VVFLIVGSAVARRFGNLRAFGFFLATAAGGALMSLLVDWGEEVPMIGASGAVFGFIAAAIRFVFQPGGPVARAGRHDPAAYFVPAAPLAAARDYRALVLLLAWLVLNVLDALAAGTDDTRISWEGHIGGFVTGLVLFSRFDPVRPRPA